MKAAKSFKFDFNRLIKSQVLKQPAKRQTAN
jgi:hypothetical protein